MAALSGADERVHLRRRYASGNDQGSALAVNGPQPFTEPESVELIPVTSLTDLPTAIRERGAELRRGAPSLAAARLGGTVYARVLNDSNAKRTPVDGSFAFDHLQPTRATGATGTINIARERRPLSFPTAPVREPSRVTSVRVTIATPDAVTKAFGVKPRVAGSRGSSNKQLAGFHFAPCLGAPEPKATGSNPVGRATFFSDACGRVGALCCAPTAFTGPDRGFADGLDRWTLSERAA
jgi:hypothetical protein